MSTEKLESIETKNEVDDQTKKLELIRLHNVFNELNGREENIKSNLNSPETGAAVDEVKGVLDDIEKQRSEVKEKIDQLEMKEAA